LGYGVLSESIYLGSILAQCGDQNKSQEFSKYFKGEIYAENIVPKSLVEKILSEKAPPILGWG